MTHLPRIIAALLCHIALGCISLTAQNIEVTNLGHGITGVVAMDEHFGTDDAKVTFVAFTGSITADLRIITLTQRDDIRPDNNGKYAVTLTFTDGTKIYFKNVYSGDRTMFTCNIPTGIATKAPYPAGNNTATQLNTITHLDIASITINACTIRINRPTAALLLKMFTAGLENLSDKSFFKGFPTQTQQPAVSQTPAPAKPATTARPIAGDKSPQFLLQHPLGFMPERDNLTLTQAVELLREVSWKSTPYRESISFFNTEKFHIPYTLMGYQIGFMSASFKANGMFSNAGYDIIVRKTSHTKDEMIALAREIEGTLASTGLKFASKPPQYNFIFHLREAVSGKWRYTITGSEMSSLEGSNNSYGVKIEISRIR